nr:reverse transcriptase domain-containing protein [Tanacetum cinerariifolium]
MDINENEEDEWEEDDDWLMASVTPPRATSFQLSTYEVGGPSAVVPEEPYLMRCHLPVVAARTLDEQGKLVAGKLGETKTQVLEMRDILNKYPYGQYSWNEFKAMMTTEYCPVTKIQRIERELLTLTLKVEQAIQAKATRIGESNKRMWEDHQGYNGNRNHNIHHRQQNKRQEDGKAYTAAPAKRKGYLGTLPLCNQCNLHHDGQCPPKCKNFKRIGHQTKDCWSKTHVADKPPTGNDKA